MENYKNVTIFNHPLIHHKIAILRDEKTSTKEFRELVEEITTLMTYECLHEGVPTVKKTVKTPLEPCEQTVVADNAIAGWSATVPKGKTVTFVTILKK